MSRRATDEEAARCDVKDFGETIQLVRYVSAEMERVQHGVSRPTARNLNYTSHPQRPTHALNQDPPNGLIPVYTQPHTQAATYAVHSRVHETFTFESFPLTIHIATVISINNTNNNARPHG